MENKLVVTSGERSNLGIGGKYTKDQVYQETKKQFRKWNES